MKVAFIGHREIDFSRELKERLTKNIEGLITNEFADTFIFGSMSEFDKLCYDIVTELKKKYFHIKRIYVRAEFEYISQSYTDYLLSYYEDTFYPTQVHGAHSLSYIKRNHVMIDMSDILVVYCNENYIPSTKTRSGTKLAVDYARKKNKRFLNVFE